MKEKRVHSRLNYAADVGLEIRDEQRQAGQLLNISTGGAFVETEPPPEFGEKITLIVDLPGIQDKCKIPCIVRWTKPGGGAGLQFEHLRPIEVWALNKLINSLSKGT
jgi:Tfp pilus assembly protein PilZ